MKLALSAFPLSMSFVFSDLPPIDFSFTSDTTKQSQVSLSNQQQQNAFTYHSYIKPYVGSIKQHTNSPLYQYLITQLKSKRPITVEFLSIDIHAKKTATFEDKYEIICQSRVTLEKSVSTTLFSYTSTYVNADMHSMPCFNRISQEIQAKINSLS